MNVNDAVHKTVHANGGAKVIAERLGSPEGVIRAKANPNDDSRWFYLPEAVELMSLTGDHRILHALADEFGYLIAPMPDSVDNADRALLSLLTDATKGNDSERDIHKSVVQLRSFIGADMRKKINKLQGYLAKLAHEIDD